MKNAFHFQLSVGIAKRVQCICTALIRCKCHILFISLLFSPENANEKFQSLHVQWKDIPRNN